jgi:hypothetical protein
MTLQERHDRINHAPGGFGSAACFNFSYVRRICRVPKFISVTTEQMAIATEMNEISTATAAAIEEKRQVATVNDYLTARY